MNVDASQANGLQESSALSVFRAWLWVLTHGFASEVLQQFNLPSFPGGRLVVTPRWQIDQLNYALDIPARIDYTWPMAVIEQLLQGRPVSLSMGRWVA